MCENHDEEVKRAIEEYKDLIIHPSRYPTIGLDMDDHNPLRCGHRCPGFAPGQFNHNGICVFEQLALDACDHRGICEYKYNLFLAHKLTDAYNKYNYTDDIGNLLAICREKYLTLILTHHANEQFEDAIQEIRSVCKYADYDFPGSFSFIDDLDRICLAYARQSLLVEDLIKEPDMKSVRVVRQGMRQVWDWAIDNPHRPIHECPVWHTLRQYPLSSVIPMCLIKDGDLLIDDLLARGDDIKIKFRNAGYYAYLITWTIQRKVYDMFLGGIGTDCLLGAPVDRMTLLDIEGALRTTATQLRTYFEE